MVVLGVEEARKRFGGTEALRGASLELRAGEMLALLGPNGAGKTTLVRAIAGRVRLDGGRLALLGRDLAPGVARPELGIVPQDLALYPALTARENLEVFGRLAGVTGAALASRVQRALEWTGLADRPKARVESYSGGMKRRLNIACGVLHEPRVVLLDEPTVGVDPQSRERIHEMLAGLRAGGASLLLTTHDLAEAESRCQRVVVMDHGRTIAAGTLPELVAHAGLAGRRLCVRLERPAGAAPQGLALEDGGGVLSAAIADVAGELPVLLERVRAAGLAVHDLDVRSSTLHEVFLALTGRELRE